ncbi:RacO protein, partial [Streptomyces sp. NPDC127051]
MPAQTRSADRVGSVSIYRYAQIVAELRRTLESGARAQFTVGDRALEIEPMREPGYREHGEDFCTVRESLLRLAGDIGLAYSSVRSARWTASKWPAQHRCDSVSFMVHR